MPSRRGLRSHDGTLPAVRGAVSSERAKILIADLSPAALELVVSRDGAEVTQVGAACPDHLVNTKRVPLWVPYDPGIDSVAELADRVRSGADGYRANVRAMIKRIVAGSNVSFAGSGACVIS